MSAGISLSIFITWEISPNFPGNKKVLLNKLFIKKEDCTDENRESGGNADGVRLGSETKFKGGGGVGERGCRAWR